MRRRASIRLQLVSRRDALQQLLGVSAATTLVACGVKPGGEGDSGSPDLSEIAPITSNADFYVTTCCGPPEVDGASWVLSIGDESGVVATIDLAGLEALGPRDKEHTLECIGGGPLWQAISNAVWTGLPLSEIFTALGVTVPASAVELKLTSADHYSTALPVADLDRPVWLVWRMNGVSLPLDHGYPARLLVPGRYGMKNPKWLTGITFVDTPYTGFWETSGWSDDASYRPNTLIHSPDAQQERPAGPLRVLGTAYAGSDPVTKVELSLDGGASWADCMLDYAPGADVWTLWHYDWDATAGSYEVQVRCITASGAMSDPDAAGTGELQGYNGSMAIGVTIT